MVMGHEMTHALREHAREQMGKTHGHAAARSRSAPRSSAWAPAAALLADMGGQLLTLEFSRDDETEADLVGLELAARAGYDPRAGVTLWQKMAEASQRAPVELLSTHPSGPTRISDIEGNLPKVEGLYARAAKPDVRFGPPPLPRGEGSSDAPATRGCSLRGRMQQRRQPAMAARRSVLAQRALDRRQHGDLADERANALGAGLLRACCRSGCGSSRSRRRAAAPSAPAACRRRAPSGRASRRRSDRSCARIPAPRATRTPRACRGRRGRRAGRRRRLRAGSTETLARWPSLPSVSSLRMPRVDGGRHRLVQRRDVACQAGAQLAAEQLQRMAVVELDRAASLTWTMRMSS